MQNRKSVQVKPAKRRASPLSPTALREHLSENGRQSFCAEGICYSKAEWDSVEREFIGKKQFSFNA